MEKYTTIDAYIASQDDAVREKLNTIRALIQELAPDAVEAISYGIPTFRLNGNLIHFAGYKGHIGLYPGAACIEQFTNLFGSYVYSKGTVQFPINEPLPLELIREIALFRIGIQRDKQQKPRIKKAAR